jgi:hypothetical protein
VVRIIHAWSMPARMPCVSTGRPAREGPCMLHASWRRAWANLMRLAIIRAERQHATDACMDDGWDGRCVSCLPACATASAICIARPNYRDLAVGIRLPSLYIHALMQMQMQLGLALARERRCSWDCYSTCPIHDSCLLVDGSI